MGMPDLNANWFIIITQIRVTLHAILDKERQRKSFLSPLLKILNIATRLITKSQVTLGTIRALRVTQKTLMFILMVKKPRDKCRSPNANQALKRRVMKDTFIFLIIQAPWEPADMSRTVQESWMFLKIRAIG